MYSNKKKVIRLRCCVKGCSTNHLKHFCKVCETENTIHFSKKCPQKCNIIDCLNRKQPYQARCELHLFTICSMIDCNKKKYKFTSYCSNHQGKYKCKVDGCIMNHERHICTKCKNKNSYHKSSMCPNTTIYFDSNQGFII